MVNTVSIVGDVTTENTASSIVAWRVLEGVYWTVA
jgi:hypothetical protein